MSKKRAKKQRGGSKKNAGLPTPEVKKEKPAEVKVEKKPPEEKLQKSKGSTTVTDRTIIGYGNAVGSKVIHAIVHRDNEVLCDSRRKGYPVIPNLLANDVTCNKCLRYKIVRQLQSGNKKVEALQEDINKTAKKTASPKAPKPEVPKQEEEVKPEPPEPEIDNLETLKSIITIKFQKLRNDMKKYLTKIVKEELSKKPQWMMYHHTDGRYIVVHEPSHLVMCSNITQEEAQECIIRYSKIDLDWDGMEKVPRGLIRTINQINKEVLKTSLVEAEREMKRREAKEKQFKPKPKPKPKKVRKPIVKKEKKVREPIVKVKKKRTFIRRGQ